MLTVGQKLKRWRLAKGLSQLQAAAKAGVSQNSWNGWENDKKQPRIAQAAKIQLATSGEVVWTDWLEPELRQSLKTKRGSA